jgi:hypothetical protein
MVSSQSVRCGSQLVKTKHGVPGSEVLLRSAVVPVPLKTPAAEQVTETCPFSPWTTVSCESVV